MDNASDYDSYDLMSRDQEIVGSSPTRLDIFFIKLITFIVKHFSNKKLILINLYKL